MDEIRVKNLEVFCHHGVYKEENVLGQKFLVNIVSKVDTRAAGKTDELGLKNIMTIEKSDQKIAKTIIENTKEKNQGILTLDSMQSTTSDDVKKGATYFSIMESNLSVLQEALQ